MIDAPIDVAHVHPFVFFNVVFGLLAAGNLTLDRIMVDLLGI